MRGQVTFAARTHQPQYLTDQLFSCGAANMTEAVVWTAFKHQLVRQGLGRVLWVGYYKELRPDLSAVFALGRAGRTAHGASEQCWRLRRGIQTNFGV